MSSDPIVTFVMTGEFAIDRTIVYGFWPPCIVRPQGWHVETVSVRFDAIMADEGLAEASVDIQDASVPATLQ